MASSSTPKTPPPSSPDLSRLLWLALGAALAALTSIFGPEQQPLRTRLTLFVLIAILWLTEALDLTVTALLVPLASVLFGVSGMREALAFFANPIIFLFLGGFALASAPVKHGLDRMLAAGCCGWHAGVLLPRRCCCSRSRRPCRCGSATLPRRP